MDPGARIDGELRAAYRGRLGLDAEPPSVEALQRLHRRQVERIPDETMWIHAGEAWGIDPVDSVARIALEGRGGYCFHLNGAFSELLRSLGYAVRRHVGGVHGPDGPDEALMHNHLVLTVSQLPSSSNPSGVWYVDAGLGDALHEPLPLAAGHYEQDPFQLAFDETPGDVGDWHMTHDPAGGFAGMSWRDAEAEIGEFKERHAWLTTSPDSGFVRVATAQRRDAAGADILRGVVLTRVAAGAPRPTELTRRTDWFEALAEIFSLRFDGVATDVDGLWDRTLTAHEAWNTAGCP